MKVIIDRFEGNFAVCEKQDKTIINIKKSLMPKGCKEGDVLIVENKKITIDIEETNKRKKKIDELTKNLWK